MLEKSNKEILAKISNPSLVVPFINCRDKKYKKQATLKYLKIIVTNGCKRLAG